MKLFATLLVSAMCLAGITCAPAQTEPQPATWDGITSGWGESTHYAGDSDMAQRAAAFYASWSPSLTVTSIGHFDVWLDSVTNNTDGTQTWTWGIYKTADGPGFNDLSHLDLGFATCGATNWTNLHGGGYGPDPSASSCVGSGDVVKWNGGFSFGDTLYHSITTDKQYAQTNVTATVKFATTCLSGSVPGPDCSTLAGPPPSGGCPPWITTLQLTSSISYSGHHGLNYAGYPIYYLGDTMQGALTICNPTSDLVDNLTVTAIQENYPGGGLVPCGSPVQVWTGVTILPNDCVTFSNTFTLVTSCPWGNYQTHVVVQRDADADCPTSAVIFDEGTVGIYDPPVEE
jgi:hypothetical protein